jgi:two-component system, response regulator YesN
MRTRRSRRRFRIQRVFYRFLFSYLFVLLIPLVFVFIFNMRYLVGNFEEYVASEARVRFEQSVGSIENEYNQLLAISGQVLNNTLLADLASDPTYENITRAKNILFNYTLTNNFVEVMLIFDRRSSKILTSTTYADFAFYFNRIYRIRGLDGDNLRQFLLRTETDHFLDYSSVQGIVEAGAGSGAYFSSSIVLGGANRNLYFGVFLNGLIISEITGSGAASTNQFYVFGPDDMLLFPDDPAWKEDYSELLPLFDRRENEGLSQIHETEFFYYSTYSKYTGLKYLSLVPTSTFLEDASRLRWTFLLSLLACATVGAAVIFLFTVNNYRPIKNLLRYTEDGEGVSGDEFMRVESTIRRMNERNDRLISRIENSRQAVAEQLLGKLLRNEIEDEEELLSLYDSLGVEENTPFRVIVIKPENTPDTSFRAEQLTDTFNKRLPACTRSLGIESIVNESFIFIVFFQPDTIPEMNEDSSGGLRAFGVDLKTDCNLIVTIAVGGVYHEYSEVSKSYLEAVSALEYSLIRGRGAIIFSDQLVKEQPSDLYPERLMGRLDPLLDSYDFSGFSHLLEELKTAIFSRHYPVYLVRIIMYEIISRVKHLILVENIDLKAKQDLFVQMESLTSLDSIDRLFADISLLVKDLEKTLTEKKVSSHFERIDAITAFISANLNDPNLSTSLLSDHIGMARAGFSRYFKQHTGITFVDYISRIRIDRAKELLVDSDMPLKQIVGEIGYSDVSAFIKKFREYTGLTPAQYRKHAASDRASIT